MQPTISSNDLLVRVANAPGGSLGSLMSDMRTWLDHQGIQPIEFKTNTLDVGSIVFDVGFRHVDQAALFRTAFAPARRF